WFPHLPEQSQYNRRLRGLVELISIVQQQLARWLDLGGVRLADGTQLAVASYPGCGQRSHFAGFARYGYSKSHHRFLWGVRLLLTCDRERLRQPQRPDAARTTPRENTSRSLRPHRTTHPRAHHRRPTQHPRRPTRTSPRRLRRPLNHIKPLVAAGLRRRATP